MATNSKSTGSVVFKYSDYFTDQKEKGNSVEMKKVHQLTLTGVNNFKKKKKYVIEGHGSSERRDNGEDYTFF